MHIISGLDVMCFNVAVLHVNQSNPTCLSPWRFPGLAGRNHLSGHVLLHVVSKLRDNQLSVNHV